MRAPDKLDTENKTRSPERPLSAILSSLRHKRITPGQTSGLLEVLAVFAVTRLVLLTAAGVAALAIPLANGQQPDLSWHYLFAGSWARWDGGWYSSIVQNGYWYNPQTAEGNVAFFPLYPMAVKAMAWLVPDVRFAGVLVSNICFLLALVCLRSLVSILFDHDTARYTIILTAAYPFSFFFGALYTESLFLFLAVASFLAAERGRWWLAGVVGMLCAMTRLVGVGLAPALFVLYLSRKGWRFDRLRPNMAAICLVPLGLFAYMGYLQSRFGDPLAFYTSALVAWQRYNVFVQGLERLNPLTFMPADYDVVYALNFILGAVFLVGVVPVWKTVGPAYAVFSLIAVAVPFSSGLESLGRYMAVVFPVYVAAASCLQHPLPRRLLVAAVGALLGLLAALFANGYWIV